MMDTTRWVLAETWLSLGLRVRWADVYESDRIPAGDWQEGMGGDPYIYAGDSMYGPGTWLLRRPSRYQAAGPAMLSEQDMLHELAHYLVATEDQRRLRNFGMSDDADTDSMELRTRDAEAALVAVVAASARIADMALRGGR